MGFDIDLWNIITIYIFSNSKKRIRNNSTTYLIIEFDPKNTSNFLLLYNLK